jgi:hypothetical protein
MTPKTKGKVSTFVGYAYKNSELLDWGKSDADIMPVLYFGHTAIGKEKMASDKYRITVTVRSERIKDKEKR